MYSCLISVASMCKQIGPISQSLAVTWQRGHAVTF